MTQTNQADPELPYLSDLLLKYSLKKGHANIIVAPCHSGKTTAAINMMDAYAASPGRVLYLIDTAAGKQSLLLHQSAQSAPYEWLEEINPFSHASSYAYEKFTVMTYHQFGFLANNSPGFLQSLQLIICDEMHNLPKFQKIQERKNQQLGLIDGLDAENDCTAALKVLAALSSKNTPDSPLIVVLTATAEPVFHAFDQLAAPYWTFDFTDHVHHDRTLSTRYYTSFSSVINALDQRAIVYIASVTQMKEFARLADNGQRKICCLWSVHSPDHPMSEYQLAVREEILRTERIPPDIDLLFINAAYETSINIRNEDFNTMIIHSGCIDTQTQVRGRLRHDINTLYIYDSAHRHIVDYFPSEYFDVPFSPSVGRQIADQMNLVDSKGHQLKWPSIRKLLEQNGVAVKSYRERGERLCRVSKDLDF